MEQSAVSATSAWGARRTLYPENEPFAFGWLPPDSEHEIYYEECGKRTGRPGRLPHSS